MEDDWLDRSMPGPQRSMLACAAKRQTHRPWRREPARTQCDGRSDEGAR